jgi:dienelactone hydrolase
VSLSLALALVVLLAVVLSGGSAYGGERTAGRDSGNERIVRRDFRVDDAGFDGVFFAPNNGAERPAVLVIAGSAGGLASSFMTAEALAMKGFPALGVAYFDRPGLPAQLRSIPLEYFEIALRALGRQPEVDPDKMAVLGASRGSEAALLLGVRYPDLVSAVIALAPANVAICSYPACDGPAWTYAGAAVPYVRPQDIIGHASIEAEIPAEVIRGPIFLACGARDNVWPSCWMASSIFNRLQQHRNHYEDRRVVKREAGHAIAGLPDWGVRSYGGGTVEANLKAQRQTWAALLRWLHSIGGSSE